MNPKRFWRFEASAGDPSSAELTLYGPISESSWWGDEITPKQFKSDLEDLGDIKALTVRINSYGGDVFAAHTIHNILRDHQADVTVRIDGIAASAATLVMLAGDEIVMPENAMIMVHNPWTIAMGDAREMRKAADTLDKVRDSMLAAYESKTGMARTELISLLNSETWMTAAEAVAKGFADTIETSRLDTTLDSAGITVNGFRFDLSHFGQAVPVALLRGASLAAPAAEINTGSGGDAEQTTTEATMETKETPEVEEQAAVTPPEPEPTESPDDIAGAERARILAIQKLSMPGAEGIVQAAIDNGDSPEAAAHAILTSDAVRKAGALQARHSDAAEATVDPEPADAGEAAIEARADCMAKAGQQRQTFTRGGIG